ncbi:MAG: di-trans,poly-cis-decaprenylcistransferase [Spirochaetaceae bacterium]|jgi:undecaprenyl diphosphate synthase|nr:di-trans,poly-cis-decaprenylcistransferase [Spirochaetaceae bacterium]
MSALPVHAGIIMDGNGRWAQARGKPRTDGHLEGLKTARKIVEAASRLGLRYLTLYVFSTENWKRAEAEVSFILGLVKRYLVAELEHYRQDRLRVRHAGDLSALPPEIAAELVKACEETKDYDGTQVILALNYGGRDEIIRAVRRLAAAGDLKNADEALLSAYMDNPDIPDPDLIIRTAGEFRTSNFLLWEAAYSEYYISEKLWPDWTEEDLINALESFGRRERRYGGVLRLE